MTKQNSFDNPNVCWPSGNSELHGLVRDLDWSQTPFGPMSTWPQCLKTVVDLLLRSPVPMALLWGADGAMIYNDGYALIAGQRHPKCLGAPVVDTWPEAADFNQNVIDASLKGDALTFKDHHFVLHRNGPPEDIWFDLNYSPVFNEHGVPMGTLAIVVETTDKIRVEDERKRLISELERSNEELSQFAHVAAHDLQSPLRMIRTYTQFVQRDLKDQLSSRTQEFMQRILEGGKRMDELIHGLLSYAQFGNGVTVSGPAAMSSIVDQALKNLETMIAESEAEVLLGDLPTVQGDEIQLVQVVQNLVGNGIKYRRPGIRPSIAINAEEDGRSWRIVVSDNGQGIRSAYQEQVFEPFKRLHGHDIPGTGMGLAVCRKIVERHGGRIWVDSEIDRGSKFSFTLPSVPVAQGLGSGSGLRARKQIAS